MDFDTLLDKMLSERKSRCAESAEAQWAKQKSNIWQVCKYDTC